MDDVKCPKCGSTNIVATKKGWDTGATAVGALIAGPIGLLAGGLNKNEIILACLKCGHRWVLRKKNEGFLERINHDAIDRELNI